MTYVNQSDVSFENYSGAVGDMSTHCSQPNQSKVEPNPSTVTHCSCDELSQGYLV